jgi:glycerol-3-phosphate acyltransferase PlsY
MIGGCAATYGGLIGLTNVGLSIAIFVILIYYFKLRTSLDELSRRFLLAGFFLGVHELTFFLGDDFVYELTKTLFFVALFYSLVYIVRHNVNMKEKLDEQNTFAEELKKRLEEVKKEIT